MTKTSHGAAPLALACLAGVAAAQQPNIVFIISDDAGWADFGFNDRGNGQIPTPELDAIAADGRWFSSAYTAPVCSPSRARIFLGMHGQRSGYDNNNPDSLNASDGVVEGLRLSDVTMWERLKAAGYTTGFFGKWHLGTERDTVNGTTVVNEGNLPPRHGIDYFFGITSGSRPYFIGGETNYTKVLREMTLDANTNLITDTSLESAFSGEYMTDVLAEEAADYITAQAGTAEPFMMTVSFTAPHGPLQATTADFAQVDALNDPGLTGNRRTYAAMMISMDDGIGLIMDRLRDPNNDGDTSDSIEDDTIVCFINDNGGETSNTARNFPLRGKKSDTFDGGIRVIMAMKGPGIPATGAEFAHPVDSSDLVPTFAAAAGLPLGPNDATDGVNLLPYLDGTLTGPPRENIYVRGNNPIVAGARVGDWKLTIENIGGPFLYDIVSNLGENIVRNADEPGLVEALSDVMHGFEASYTKPRWGVSDVNGFDRFRWRAGAIGSGSWSTANAWSADGGAPATATMFERDGYANFRAVFSANEAAYTATNDLRRLNGFDMISNGIEFTGTHSTGVSGVSVSGQPLMLVNSLDGVPPELRNDLSSTNGTHPAEVALDLRLWDDLLISGSGNQPLVLRGSITDERDGRSVLVSADGGVMVTGEIAVGGTVDLAGGETAVVGTGHLASPDVVVSPGAKLTLLPDAGTPDTIGNRSTLSVSSPSAGEPPVSLSFDGIEVVGGLTINGVPQSSGVFGAASDPAIFSGSGRIVIRGPLEDCPSDVNDDGFANVFDVLGFLAAFDANDGCGAGSSVLPSGLTVSTDAALDTPGDGSWEVSPPATDLSRPWTFPGNLTPEAAGMDAPSGINVAYRFPAAAATGPDYEDPSRSPSSVEIWFRPDALSGDQILWEAGGGSRGGALWLSGNELRLDVRNGSPAPVRAATTIGPGWRHVMAVIDISAGQATLYVDGQFANSVALGSTDRWAGGNPSGLGTVASSAVGSITPPDFTGLIAVYRHYNGALMASEVMDAFDAVADASPPCDASVDLDADGQATSADALLFLQNLEVCD